MKRLLVLAAIAAGSVILICCNQTAATNDPAPTPDKEISADSLIKRGAYLVTLGGCGDCHSPKLMGPQGPYPDPDKLFSGHPAEMPVAKFDAATAKEWVLFNHMETATVGPWGTTFAANITSDSTGIGGWTEAQFFKAMREGKYKGLENSRPIMPPMPWPNLAKASDDDLKAIFAYLKSTKPVKNVVPAAILNPPPPPQAAAAK